MVIPEKQALLCLEAANYTEAQQKKITDYKNIGWEITYEEGKSLSSEDQKIKKSPKEPQEKNDFSNKKERINGSMGSLPSENLEGSPVPDAKAPFESTVTSDPTQSSRYLKFTTDRGYVSKVKQGYKITDSKDLNYLNRYAGVIQDTAQWYQ